MGTFEGSSAPCCRLAERLVANLGFTCTVDKKTTLWSHPLLRHTPSLAVYGGKPAADLWFCKAPWVADVRLTTTRSPSSSRSNTSQWASRNVSRKRDAATSPLQRLHAHMVQLYVRCIGGDFNMSDFGTVGDVFSDPVFAAPNNSLLWGLGGLDGTCRQCTGRECVGFIIMPKHPHTWKSTPTAATSSTTLT